MAGAPFPAAITIPWITKRTTCWLGPRVAAPASPIWASHAGGTTDSDTPRHGNRLTPPGTSHPAGSHLRDARIPANDRTGNSHTGLLTSAMRVTAGSRNRPTGLTWLPVPSDPERPIHHYPWIPFLTGHCSSRRRIGAPCSCPLHSALQHLP